MDRPVILINPVIRIFQMRKFVQMTIFTIDINRCKE